MDAKERKITDAALRLFQRHGYRKVTMADIAAEAGMSRPSLYASFANKEAIFAALMDDNAWSRAEEADAALAEVAGLRARLEIVLEVWVLRAFASVIGHENSADLLANCAIYAPEAAERLYARLEEQIRQVLEPEMGEARANAAADLAHLLMMTARGLKATTGTVGELRRLMDGLVTMAVATVEASRSG